MNPARLISFVIGNGYVKTWSATKQAIFPSVVATEQAGIDFSGFKTARDVVIEYEGQRYAIGDSVRRLARIPITQMDRSRVKDDIYKVLLSAALVATTKDSGPVSAVLTMPLQWYAQREEVKHFLEGEYIVGHNGKTYTYSLQADDIRMIPEGFGVLCLQYLDEQGCPARSNIERATVGVVEVGTGTTDLSFFNALSIVPIRSRGLPYGLSQVWRGVQADIDQNYHRDFTLHEIDDLIRAGRFKHNGEVKRVDQYVEAHMPTFAQAVSAEIKNLWDSGAAADHIYIAGGGGPQIYPYLQYKKGQPTDEQPQPTFPHAELTDRAWTADAEGAYRYGMFRLTQKAKKNGSQ
jgi:plasmid segregation protein ParM